MIILIIIIILYILPGVSMYIWTKMAYGKGGTEEGKTFDMTYFWIMICPGLNIFGIILWTEYPKKDNVLKKELKEFVTKKIFNIK